MQGEKKVFPLPTFRVYSPEDLSKKWFVYWYEGRKRIRKYGSINSMPTAEERMKAARQLIAEVKSEMQRRVTKTEEALRAFLAANRQRWRPATFEQYESIVNVLADWLGGRDLDQQRLEDFLQQVLTHRHPTTYNKYLAILPRLFRGAGLHEADVARVPAEVVWAAAEAWGLFLCGLLQYGSGAAQLGLVFIGAQQAGFGVGFHLAAGFTLAVVAHYCAGKGLACLHPVEHLAYGDHLVLHEAKMAGSAGGRKDTKKSPYTLSIRAKG